jgi:hypothetical protein
MSASDIYRSDGVLFVWAGINSHLPLSCFRDIDVQELHLTEQRSDQFDDDGRMVLVQLNLLCLGSPASLETVTSLVTNGSRDKGEGKLSGFGVVNTPFTVYTMPHKWGVRCIPSLECGDSIGHRFKLELACAAIRVENKLYMEKVSLPVKTILLQIKDGVNKSVKRLSRDLSYTYDGNTKKFVHVIRHQNIPNLVLYVVSRMTGEDFENDKRSELYLRDVEIIVSLQSINPRNVMKQVKTRLSYNGIGFDCSIDTLLNAIDEEVKKVDAQFTTPPTVSKRKLDD